MSKVVIKQSRVCDYLRAAGLPLKKKDDREFILKHYQSVPGLQRRKTSQANSNNGEGCWYDYESARVLDVFQAEKEIAESIAVIIRILI
ncbi:hypothetical protein [Aeoliella mucimassa]|uniref:Uncharacterized protein n=1 Tax=Aeoliella mucimassa TaxID=2527972 RepID=A0A518AKK6_9BACT|nr:hypothetical protein [Aeoliella mucimassa]QDU55265.1 hypothetical protein Pan181_14530 [Aeoliella mucimassa]